ncbi:MAG: DUF4126 domain-containing protein [Bacteroidales bacterium]
MDTEILTAVAIGIGLSATCGFRVFVPMFVASIAVKMGIFPVQEGFQWLATWPAIISFGTATVVEILAYYVPYVDNLLDTITTPLAIVAGSLLLTSVLPIDNDLLKWITGVLFGGGAAATIQGGSVLTRLASTKLTGGTGNAIVATGEHAAAFGSSLLSVFIPFLVAALVILLVVFIIVKFRVRLLKRKPV